MISSELKPQTQVKKGLTIYLESSDEIEKDWFAHTDDFLCFVVSDLGTSANGLLVLDLEGTKLSLCKCNIFDYSILLMTFQIKKKSTNFVQNILMKNIVIL